MTEWYVYLIRCKDNSLYCGITTDVDTRFEQHRTGKGAKYTRSHPPIAVVYSEGGHNRSTASKREYEIKQWTKARKERLVSDTNKG